jgi:hypothetical protein
LTEKGLKLLDYKAEVAKLGSKIAEKTGATDEP